MNKIKKVFTIIGSSIVLLFFKTIKVFADAPMPTAAGSVPQGMYGVYNQTLGTSLARYFTPLLLFIAIPIYIIWGFVVWIKLKNKTKQQSTNMNPNDENEQIEVMTLKRKLKTIIIGTVIIAIIAIILLIIYNTTIDNYPPYEFAKILSIIVCILIGISVAIVMGLLYKMNRIQLDSEIQKMHVQKNNSNADATNNGNNDYNNF